MANRRAVRLSSLIPSLVSSCWMRWLNVDSGVRSVQFDLFLGVPKHRVPSVVVDSGMAEKVGFRSIRGPWRPTIPASTPWETAPTPAPRRPAGSPEGAALAVASALIAKLRNGGKATEYDGI